MIKSPLNYTGNKSRLLDQIIPFFPKKISRFVDLCCGGASVGLNVEADNILCLDLNKEVIDLLRTLKTYGESKIIEKVEQILKKFELSDSFNNNYGSYRDYIDGNNGLKRYNKDGYIKLRDYYNGEVKYYNYMERSIYLYTLLAYCFNNDMRFNSNGNFNMPVGKTDFNKSIRKKLSSFKEAVSKKNIDFITADINIIKELELNSEDFLYIDPPYLITTAVYNENNNWNKSLERELLTTLDFIHKSKVKFALSNVIAKNNRKNEILMDWIQENKFNVVDINSHYRSASYNKIDRNAKEREVLIMNYDI